MMRLGPPDTVCQRGYIEYKFGKVWFSSLTLETQFSFLYLCEKKLQKWHIRPIILEHALSILTKFSALIDVRGKGWLI